jgi:hypothetical protein
MTHPAPMPRRGTVSILMIAASLVASVAISLAMDAVLVFLGTEPPANIVIGAALFNGTVILQSAVGGIIEWRRPGHTIGRLLMLSGPLYACLAAGWLTAETLQPIADPGVYLVLNWAGTILSWPGVALIVGWVPLLFPTGTLPGPRWRIPAAILVVVSTIGFVALSVRPGPLNDGTDLGSPIAIEGWPDFLQVFVDAIPIDLLGLLGMAIAGLVARYRRGDPVERLQIRWYVAAVALAFVGFVLVVVEQAIGPADAPRFTALVAYAGILLMPIAIGIAILRYRLFEIDRIISRTIGWALVTGILGAVFASAVVGLQAALAGVTQGQTLAVAASTLVAFALFQPLRRRVQSAVNRRFDRARVDADRTAAAFADRLRDQIDLGGLEADIARTIESALRPSSTGVWIRGASR